MRIHSLNITAFGPFADTVCVDFDALGKAGLFLLSGATGAGKTSVLDAVCFGLYGEVPGDRNTAKRLRSDHAAPDAAPEVELEVTLAGRRFRLRRSPQWHRPKKRGLGTTLQQASVLVQERVDGTWTTRSTRLDEAGHLIGGLLGMNLNQFCQVALLPQGRFQAFLRARSEERQQLLQQLFRTERFADIEAWLAEHRRASRRASTAAEGVVVALATRLSEASGEDRPQADSPDPLIADEIRDWSTRVVTESEAARQERDDERSRLADRAAQAGTAHQDAERLARLREAYLDARSEERRLSETSEQQARNRATLILATRADSLSPLIRLCDRARGEHEAADAELRTALVGAGITWPDRTSPNLDLDERLTQQRNDLALLRAMTPQAAELHRLDLARDQWTVELGQLSEAVERSAQEHAAASGEVLLLTATVERAQKASLALLELRSRVEEADAQVAAHDQVLILTAEAEADLKELNAQRDETLALKEAWLAVREARLNGMAAEIASRLVVGASCPVCGSADHPHVAQAMDHAPDARSERVARSVVDDAEAALHAREDRYRELAVRLDLSRQALGGTSREECSARTDEMRIELRQVVADADALPLARAAFAAAHAAATRAQDELCDGQARLGSVEVSLQQSLPLFTRLREELTTALSRYSAQTLEDALNLLSGQVAALELAQSARRRWDSTATDLKRNRSALLDASHEAGFPDSGALQHALLAPERRLSIEAMVTAYDARAMAVQQQLGSAELRAAASGDAPDPRLTREDLAATRTALGEAESRLAGATNRVQRVRSLAVELEAALNDWKPLVADLDLAARMAGLAEGTSPDNTLQMRLSAFVLAYRLGQVVDAANERLLRMSDQRYSLEHTDRRGAGERRGGLSLLVRDDWSGETRDPATLSGGETFVVSLALALGLADVISQEIGGADLDTLFVDEGFGALDSETLDDVMDTLDSLREGGRVVGVVSHVAEMRHRIPTRLHVTKRRSGSTVDLIHGS